MVSKVSRYCALLVGLMAVGQISRAEGTPIPVLDVRDEAYWICAGENKSAELTVLCAILVTLQQRK
ncbi:hypothetical protein DL239_02525 [Sedimentitalea sp. CY04]|uniref:Uncharacterized protein n=1 Tax=Parasedimentitalea denitrificans TaxID=2211118 RepID=A0ABX0W5C7_9RHOB|nr:hypothetical protein [Sedimentitalea sp. CY04]